MRTAGFHRVDLLPDGAGTEIRAHRGGAGAGHDDGGHHRTDLGDRGQSRSGPRQITGADLQQNNVEREHDQDGVGHREHDRRHDRNPGDEPDLLDQFTPGEGSPEDTRQRLPRENDEVADRQSWLRPRRLGHQATSPDAVIANIRESLSSYAAICI